MRKVLAPILKEFGQRLDDESFRTMLCEVETIVNSRPITTIPDNTNDLEALTQSHLLTQKCNVQLAPPGISKEMMHIYMRKRWCRVQYLANVFWRRWKKEYLQNLQERQKWKTTKHNLQLEDIVLLKDDNIARNTRPMGKVTKLPPDETD